MKSYERGYGIVIPIIRTELWEWDGIRESSYEQKFARCHIVFFEKRYHVGEAVCVTKSPNFKEFKQCV